MKNNLIKTLFGIFAMISANAAAIESFTASKTQMTSGESVLLEWRDYSPSQYYPAVFNLYVTKPDGSPRFAFRQGLTTPSFNRLINMIGTHKFEVEVCDADDGRCGTPAAVYVNVSPACERQSNITGYWYSCAGRQVTQTAYSRILGPDSINDFQLHGDKATWRHGTGGSGATAAYYVADLTNGGYRQLSQKAYYMLLGNDSISGFKVVNDRAVWRFYDRSSSHYAYYTTCLDGSSFSQLTESGGSGGDSVSSFKLVASGWNYRSTKASWTFYDGFWNTSSNRSVNLGLC